MLHIAEQSDINALKSQIDSLTARVTALEGGSPPPDPPPDPPPSGSTLANITFRDQAAINANTHVNLQTDDNPVIVAGPDHGTITIGENIAGMAGFIPWKGTFESCQLRPEFTPQTTGTVRFDWHCRFNQDFRDNLGGVATHKAFQLSREGNRIMEVRNRYGEGGTDYALIDVRNYLGVHEGPPQDILYHDPASGKANPLHNFEIFPDQWINYRCELDLTGQTFSMWVNNIPIYDAAPVNVPSVDSFWVEFDSSQTRAAPAAVLCDIKDLLITVV